MITPRNDEYLDATVRLETTYLAALNSDGTPMHSSRSTSVDTLGYGLWTGKYVEYRQTMAHEPAVQRVQNEIAAIEGRPLPYPPPVPPPPVPTGLVYLSNRCMGDDDGPACFLGATYFPLMWMVTNEYSRAGTNLLWLAKRGVQFVRVLAEVGGPTWEDRTVDPRAADWLAHIRHVMILAKECALRVEWTLFGGGVLTKEREWSDATDRFIDAIRPMLDGVQCIEIRNEEQGPPDELARQLAGRVRMMLGCPVAICGSPENRLSEIYKNSRATVMTFHPDRQYAERGYRTIRQIKHDLADVPVFWMNNEPVGIQSSVAQESDPVRLAAAAITTWVCGAGAHVVHTGAGIRAGGAADLAVGRVANVWEQPTLEAALSLIQQAKGQLPAHVCNWSRKTHGWADHPLKFTTLVGDAVEAGAPGCNRAYAMVAPDGRWVCFIGGIRDHVTFTASSNFSAWMLPTGNTVTVAKWPEFTINEQEGACALLMSV